MRNFIAFMLPSPFYGNPERQFGYCGEYNAYIAIPNELIKKQWKDPVFGYISPVAVTKCCFEVTLTEPGSWAKESNLYKNIVGNVEDIDDTYTIIGWDYSHSYNNKENASFKQVMQDIKDVLCLLKEEIK